MTAPSDEFRDTIERQLRESEQRFRLAWDSSVIGLAILAPEGRILQVNPAAAAILGYDEATLCTIPWTDLIDPTEVEDSHANFVRVVRGEVASTRAVRRYRRRDGTIVHLAMTASPMRDTTGTITGLFVQAENVTEEHRLNLARQEMEERLQRVLDATQDGVWDWNLAEGTAYFAPQWFGMLGYPAEGRWGDAALFRELMHPDDAAHVWAANERQINDPEAGAYDERFRMRRADGSWAWIRSRGRVIQRDASGRALRMVGTHTDITEHRMMEEQFRHAQKMEAIGKLAGGVAHDFNNLLTTISATTQVLREELSADDPHRADLDQIALAADRAKALTGQLLAFSRLEVEQRQHLPLDQAVRQVEPLLRRLLAPGQRLAVTLDAPDALVSLDPAQLELALLNLVANARDAMPGGGMITIRTDRASPHDVTLAVSDTGHGMDPAVAERAFEPFFTTKPQGKGTGLGLATVYGFAERLGGGVTLRTAPQAGTTVALTIPLAHGAEATPAPRAAAVAVPRQTGRCVLVVDDEEGVRRSTRRLLERRGYTVLEAESAAGALAVLEHTAVDVMLTDHAMPDRTGRDLAHDVMDRHPLVRVVLMSGFAGEGDVRDEIRGRAIPFLPKPFTLEELVTMIDPGE